MASISMNVAVKRDWPFANPWAWLGAGVCLTLWSLAWTLVFRPIASDGRIIVLAFGLLALAVGMWMRQSDRQTSYVRERMPGMAMLIRLFMGGVFALAALGVTILMVLSFRSAGPIHAEPACMIWLMVAPLALGASWRCLRRKERQEMIEVDEEIGFGYCVVAGCCFLGSLTLLRDPAEPTDWDSMRMFLRVVMALSGYAGGLMLCSLGLRRLMLSFAFLLHFAGICSAALAAPPAAWIVQQTWMRFFRPYLEFMYLNNAYHFYAPDPGPSSYLWFRVILTDEKGENDHGLWYKLPQVDDKGRLKHPVALEYQRYLSMTESVAQKDSLPSDYYFDEKQQQWLPRPMFANRLKLAQPAAGLLVIGVPEVNQPRIPFHPDISLPNQVNIPSDGPRRLLSSYARHIAEKYDTYTDDDGKVWKFKSVKIYRVIHNIPPVIWFRNKWSPTDPTLYQPFYVGNYNAEGRLLKDNDPYLYWLLPIIRQRPNDPNSVIYDYCRKHAGDPHWERKVGDPD